MTMKMRSFCKRSTFVLTGISWLGSLCLAIALCGSPAHAQGTFTAASCNRSDVNAVINGPTHTAVDGDTIIIPAGSCTWTSGITINGVGIDITGTGTPNTGAATFGAGASNTTLIDNASVALFAFINLTYGETAKVELFTLSAAGAANYASTGPISFQGTCTTSGCAQIRADNIFFTTGTWDGPIADGGFVRTDNVFGVVDHTTSSWSNAAGVGGAGPPLVEVNQSAWQGVGAYGDNSFASADSMGTAQALFIENNSLTGNRATDNDVSPVNGHSGGDRDVCRFNVVVHVNGSALCSGHGTTWNGYRGQRQLEAYYHTITCGASGSSDCNGGNGLAGGTGVSLSNKFIVNSGHGFNSAIALAILRQSGDPLGIWGYCDGTQPYDQTP